ncbi:transient receptor potential cation channel subfamily M member-like 2 isoform X4 [Ruditapes philippinarum]|uniref:transient receptor potential cation channel subfamily M member-like 2 isoform X4 n=1 Tax=Ruditapes philippinarum TaxID=129788 RepID=UPI00295AD95A|nr:transient receptor potential cation channel subfamily M member-like 2 isoform X4 [Ruditapes philippinarum]
MSSENDEVIQDSVDVGNKMNKMDRQSEQTVGTSNDAGGRRHFVEDVTSDTSPLLGASIDSEESWIKLDSDLKREREDATEQVDIEVEDISLNNIHMNTFPGLEQSLEDQIIDQSNNNVEDISNSKSFYNEKSDRPHTYRMDSNQNHARSNVEDSKLIEKTSAVVEEKKYDIEITNIEPSLISECDSDVKEEEVLKVDALDGEEIVCMSRRERVSIGDYHYIRMNAFPLTKHDAVSSLDSVSSDEVDGEVFEDTTKENCSALGEPNSVEKQEKYKRDKKRAVRFLASYWSRDSLEAVDMIDADFNGNNEDDEVDMDIVPKVNIRTDRSQSVVKKHASVLGELKSQVKAVKQEQLQKEKDARRRFGNVLKELKAYSLELDEETKWIRGHIKRRECSSFIPPANTPEEERRKVNCQCGYAYNKHIPNADKKHLEDEKWAYKKHSIQKTTNAFGDIEFVGYGGNVGKYIRVDVDTKMSDMLDLMMQVWGLDKPNLLISVTGGAKNFQMNKRLKETFRRGLMKTALTTGAWIVTGGTHAGVMKHVGEAVKDFGVASTSKNPVISIGIAPWGCIQNKEVLIDDQCTGLWPANYRIEKEQKPKESFLDPNHTHFILVDNATEHKFAVEIPFRARLENKIAKIRTDTGDNAVSVPIVLLVLEGGPGTLETVHQAIQNNTPSVIVKGSGRAADILAYAYQNSKEEEIEATDQEGKKQKKARRFMDDSLLVEVKEMVEKEFKNDVDTHVGRIKDCLEKCDLMSVFELDNKSGVKEIDVAMLQALLKANKNQVFDQLRLALAWNRIDVAKSDIFTDDKRWPTGSLDDVMFSAIQLNRVDFIELFLDHGVSLREFLTKKRLLLLYNKISSNCLLRTLLDRVKHKEDSHRKNFSLLDVGILIQSLMGDSFRPIYTTKPEYAYLDVDLLLDGLTTKKAKEGGISAFKAMTELAMNPASNQDDVDGRANQKHQSNSDFENPSQELFIWSVLMIRQGMAKLFWAEGKDAIAAALVANSILQAMRNKTDDTEVVLKIQHDIDEWSELAVGVLSECYSTDEKKAQDLLVREQTNWGDTTCMLIAVKADNKVFISQTACQSLLNSIWMGKLAQDNSSWKLVLCVLCPPLALVLLNFQKKQVEKPNNQLQNQLYELDNNKKDDVDKKLVRRQTTFMKSNLKGSRTSLRVGEESKDQTENDEQEQKKMLGVRERIYYFFNAPVIIFMNNVLSYLVFLGLFTYVLIFDFNPNVTTAEIILMIWVFTIFSEEVRQISRDILSQNRRQVATTASNSLAAKLQSYITDTWNIVDIITIVLFIIGMVLRFLPHSTTFEAARVFLALNFVSFFLRLLHIFSVHKELGPKLVMIGRMVQDLMYFLVILMVFVVSYAIASHSILFPNSPLRWYTIVDVIRKSYWNIYGELFLEEIEGTADCSYDEVMWLNGTLPRCPTDTGKIVVPILMGVYMLLANVLLLNLLIAMFSYTFTLVQDNTDKHWFFQRYSLIYEYYTRPVLCPPLIFFSHVYLLVKFLFSCCCCQKSTSNNDNEDDFRRKFKNERELVQWENVIADAFHQKTELKDFESMEYKVNDTNTLIKELTSRIDELQEQQLQLSLSDNVSQSQSHLTPITPVSPSSVIVKMPPKLEFRLEALEKSMEMTHDSLKWIMNSLKEGKVASDTSVPPTFIDWEEQRLEEKRKLEIKAGEERAKVREMLLRGINCHFRSRTSPYPGSLISRFPVPDDKVSWEAEYPEYSPSAYTAPELVQDLRPEWADIDIFQLTPQQREAAITSFNAVDGEKQVDRMSFLGEYVVQNGLPLNPKGRTGLQSRGLLGRWGPNHAGDPVVTRWKKNADGSKVLKEGKPVLEFVAVLRADNQMWALPGAILPPGAKPADHLQADFTDEAMGSLEGSSNEKVVRKKMNKIWKKGVKIYEGYADDPRNTDNAWIETTAISYHDEDGAAFSQCNLRAGERAELVTWLTGSHKVTLHGSHLYLVKLAAERLGAYF